MIDFIYLPPSKSDRKFSLIYTLCPFSVISSHTKGYIQSENKKKIGLNWRNFFFKKKGNRHYKYNKYRHPLKA